MRAILGVDCRKRYRRGDGFAIRVDGLNQWVGETVFLHLLNADQKGAFLTMAQRLSLADGEDDFDEISALDDIKAQMHFSGSPDMSEVLGELPLDPFKTPRDRSIALMELLLIAYADGYLHEAESALIGDIAAAFDINQERLTAMAEWAMDALDLARGANQILGDGGA